MAIHPTAIISPKARLSSDVNIGAYAIVEGPVSAGPGTVVHAHAILRGPLTMGARNVIHSGAVIGGTPQDRKFKDEFSQTIIGDDNVFREGVTVHRGTGADTRTVIGSRCYFMANSHVGHNGTVGNDVTLINGSAVGGFGTVGDRAILGAASSLHQFCRIGRLTMISNCAGLNVNFPPFCLTMSTNTFQQLNIVGLRRSNMPRNSINALREMFKLAFRDQFDRPALAALLALPADILAIPEVQEVIEFYEISRREKRGVARFVPWSRKKNILHEQIPSEDEAVMQRRRVINSIILMAFLAFSGCYERKETAILNADGSGKMVVVTDVAVPAANADGPNKIAPIDYGKAFVRDFINGSRGVDGWADVSVSEAPDHRAHITATAYFNDITRVRFDLPLVFDWKKQPDGTYVFALMRERAGAGILPSDDEVKQQVGDAKARYQSQRNDIQAAMNAFRLSVSVSLPGAVSDARIFSKDQSQVAVAFDGKKLAPAIDAYMADDAAIAATLKKGLPLMSDDDLILSALFAQKGPVQAKVKVADGAEPAFNYKAELREVQAQQLDMLQAAGVELIPKLRIAEPATETAPAAATQPH